MRSSLPRLLTLFLLLCGAMLCVPLLCGPARAAAFLPLGETRGPLLQQGQALIAPRGGTPSDGANGGASLFTGTQGGSFFEPVVRAPPLPALAHSSNVAEHIRNVIALAEAGPAGYDAIQHGARSLPRKRPTAMTLGEIYDWIAATPGQPHAIGRYQFVPDTLRALVRRAGLSRETRFTPRVQDHLADLLLHDAGLPEAQRGEITPRSFMHNLAGIWAGLPLPSGKSRYHGYAGNKATMTWARFELEMAPVFRR
ncbi:glycoside hydrolase family 104 protein [Salipiger sp. HF18]|nr:glycoside hydrolase family 104 protein [Salipiger sp. HF18]